MPVNPTVVAEYKRLVERDYRWNRTAFVSWDFVWGLGLPFALYATSVPAYLGALNAPKALIGLMLSFPTLFAVGQILMSYLICADKRMAVLPWLYLGCVVPLFIYSATAFFWGAAWPLWFHCVAFTIVQMVFIGVTHLLDSVYWEIITDNIPPLKRGWLFGLRMIGAGVPILLMGYVAILVLSYWKSPQNFQMAFVIGSALYILSCPILWLIRDHVNPEHETETQSSKPPFGRYLQTAFHTLWQDPNYRIFVFFMILLSMAVSGAPFMVDAARSQLHASPQAQGLFNVAFMLSCACLGWMVGLLADRFGYCLIGTINGGLMAGAFLICLLTYRVEYWYVAYGAYAIATSSIMMLLCNMSAELCPQLPPNRSIAVGSILMVLCVVPTTTLSGWIVDRIGSYQPIFITDLILSLVAMFGFGLIVREPRTGHLYTMKIIPRG